MSAVRTDGYDMSVTTVRAVGDAGRRAFNVDRLPKRGLNLKKYAGDLNNLESNLRGIFDISDPLLKRLYPRTLDNSSLSIQITGVDFGLAKPYVAARGDLREILKSVKDTIVSQIHLSNSFCDRPRTYANRTYRSSKFTRTPTVMDPSCSSQTKAELLSSRHCRNWTLSEDASLTRLFTSRMSDAK